AAMYGYAGASASATALSPFTEPPPTTNTAGLGGQAAAVAHATAAVGTNAETTLSQLISTVPQTLQGLAASAPSAQAGPIISILDALAGPLGPASLYGIGGVPYLLALQCVLLPMNGSNVVAALTRAEKMTAEGTWPPNPFDPRVATPASTQLVNASGAGPSVSARLGTAGSVGRLSVPQGWTAATPAAKAVAAALPNAGREAVSLVAADSQSGLMSDLALGGLAGRAIGASGGAASRKVGGVTGSLAGSKPSTATIIVIPPSVED
ncbi:MAG: PPE family protein, SVP subgroup, partial [Mycobacterium sp.]